MTRNQFLDFVKGLLIIMVVIGHTLQFVVLHGKDFWEDPLFKMIYMFHMPLFMAVSGFLSYSGINKSRLTNFIPKKCKSYVLPIFSWAIIFIIALDLISLHLPGTGFPWQVLAEALERLWFLWALLGSLIITILVKSIGRWFWSLYLASSFVLLLLPEEGNLILLKSIYPFFQMGYAVAAFRLDKIRRTQKNILFFASLPITMFCYFAWNVDTYIYSSGMLLESENLSNIGIRLIGGTSASLLFLFATKIIHDRINPKFIERIALFGSNSIYIYILQSYLFFGINLVVAKYGFPETQFPISQIVAIVVGIVFSALCLLGGHVIAMNSVLAAVFFGRFGQKADPPKDNSRVPIT